jgi:hypothetical protein
MLNDDEILIQTSALAIMGNMMLLRESHHHLSGQIPHYLDMALSFIVDIDCPAEKRKEAILIVNNFITSFNIGIECLILRKQP